MNVECVFVIWGVSVFMYVWGSLSLSSIPQTSILCPSVYRLRGTAIRPGPLLAKHFGRLV